MAEENNLNNDEKIVNKAISESQKEILNEFKKGTIDLKKAIYELTNVTKNDILGTKQRINDLKSLNEAIKQNTTIQKQALEESKKSNISTKLPEPEERSFEQIYRARQIAGGMETIAGGNFASGIRQIASAFPQIAKFMTGPYYIALSMATKGLIAFDRQLTQMNKSIMSTTGGIYSDYLNKSYAEKLSYSKTIEDMARNYHRQGEKAELMQALQSNFAPSIAYNAQSGLPIIAATLANRTAFEGIGIDKNYSDQLLFKLIRQQGLTPGSASGQLNNLLKFASDKKRGGIYSDQELIKKSDEVYNLTKMFGTSMDWASRYVNKFSREIELGTIAMSDFASYNKGMREGDTGKLAGIGQQLIEHGQAMGLSIPKELLEASGNPLAVAWTMRKLGETGNKDMLKLMSSWMGMHTGNISGGNEAAAKEALYSLIGPNLGFGKLSQPQVEGIVKGNFKNLEGAYAVSGYSKDIENFNNYQNLIKNYLDKNTEETVKLSTAVGQVFSDLHQLFSGNKRIPVYIDGQQINSQMTGADVKRWNEINQERSNFITGPTKVS